MKKLFTLFISILFVVTLTACGTGDEPDESDGSNGESQTDDSTEETNETTSITVGATAVPHAEVLEQAKPILAEQGIDLKIETYDDYVLPNRDLYEGRLDANYYQHTPYLNQQLKEFEEYDFVSLGGIHIEPIGIYSSNISSVDEIPENTPVLLSSSVADHGRILALFEREGLITFKDGVDPQSASIDDIDENPKNLEFDATYDPALLPQFYEREEDALVAINTNYAIEADLHPAEDALILEGSESPYANLVVTNSENENDEALQTLVEVLRSEEIQNFMEEEYKGAIVPVSE
ncbi:MetQ/NlpA family ABC transporter substrate-binding protein [Salinibacillus xinjiangensis]|uniref:Lipoprotein n=1 Tax=Salinibacillus xinjiangensis TaxID=1229268 RepID=A0A6G1X2N5_9BACI|nr:MetQ/NlpA family ABC transporter substrate-binding protein [Salinibacillus xinjiangensis]MRG85156.1 methionine ABC transporter substrate-binding protein [Salinibacillus xinjiangensis]